MGLYALMGENRDEQRDEIMGKRPGERLPSALELSDVCAFINYAGRKSLEKTCCCKNLTRFRDILVARDLPQIVILNRGRYA
jgi:hypothetical protein